ncbi:potassium/sodium hyperpolarization-activated cyclic nucleotide-gated channel 1-like [Hylaeus volcanicus]|uniref:potassium/sodium hyperpolarization-activated cyclic nucleotide-gated channel 1-like n=1 Tax=Hylaeus volcanicus TaxID=313075 RepID=UPI0023B7B2E7|nr:potassium/sodium hyperpolarization-activated cyclic nucleotide-gated channel 1-like [Hylaeus volcanicus]
MDLMAYVPHFSEAPNVEYAPIIQHICQQPTEQDELENHIKGNSIGPKLQRWFMRQRILSRKHPLTRWWLKSTSTVNYEISRHIKSYPYMIHPFSSFRIVWESLMAVFTFVGLLIIPVSITFHFENHDNWHIINDMMNIVFLCDIVMWFFTGYYDYRTKVIVLDPRIVALKYLKNYFLIDFMTVLPIGFIDLIIPNSTWYCTTLNMLKILRIRNIIVYSRRLHNVYRMSFQQYKILETFSVIVVCVHWAGCLEYYVPMSVDHLGTLSNDSWIRSSYFRNKKTKVKRYLVCLNRAVTSLVRSAHYLDVKTPEDIILNLILTVVGFLGFMYLLTQFSHLMTTFHITIKRHLKIIQQLQEYMRYKELPHSLQRRLLIFYHYRNRKGFERDAKIINQVSPYLREELILHNYLRLISTVELFKHLPETVVSQLVSELRSEIFMTGDEIVKAGTLGESLYFIACGTVAVYTSTGKEVCHLEDGTYFGEMALVMESDHRIATVIAVETCEVNVLDRNDFRRHISPYPDLLNRLQNVALEHLEKSLALGDAYNLDAPTGPRYINISSIQSSRKDVPSHQTER